MSEARADRAALHDWIARGPRVLDGATGTELARRGVDTALPLWSAGALTAAPDVVAAIHRDYVEAGAEVVVANTFRTNARTLRAAGLLEQAEVLNRTAVELARRAIAMATDTPAAQGAPVVRRVLVAASVAPVEDCYHPERVPGEATLRGEHARMMAWLAAAGPDLVWIETMNTVREARAAAGCAAEDELPFAVSFVVRENGDLLGGEPLEAAVAAVEPFGPLALGLNCIPPAGMTANLPRLRRATGRPLSAYAHIGNPEPIRGWSFSSAVGPAEYGEHVRRWLEQGAMVVGGGCGTTPAHVAAVRGVIHRRG
jgi:S-methylmethionine-dependent homocysteine/selenocysteine methylase